MLFPGECLRDYEIVAPLRSDGLGWVFLARRRGVGGFRRQVALKVVHSRRVGDEGVQRSLINEARISAQIAHPNVIKVEEAGTAGHWHFLALEYVPGVSLAELLEDLALRGRRMNLKLCVWVAAQAAEGLRAIHEATNEKGAPLYIVHRDVRPQKLLVARTGHIKLMGFGVAAGQQTRQIQARRGALPGKLGYMAPEQLRSEAEDRRSDVYGLGVVLWEMLTARRFLRGERIDDERDWSVRRSPPPPSQYCPKVPLELDAVVLRALAYDPDARFRGALAFRAALLAALPEASQMDAPALEKVLGMVHADELVHGDAGRSLACVEPALDEATELVREWDLPEPVSEIRSLRLLPIDDDCEEQTLAATPAALHVVPSALPALAQEPAPIAMELPQAGLLQAFAARAAGLVLLCVSLGALIGWLAMPQGAGRMLHVPRAERREHVAAPARPASALREGSDSATAKAAVWCEPGRGAE